MNHIKKFAEVCYNLHVPAVTNYVNIKCIDAVAKQVEFYLIFIVTFSSSLQFTFLRLLHIKQLLTLIHTTCLP